MTADSIAATLQELVRRVLDESQCFEALKDEARKGLAPYRPLPKMPPLAFLHLPKTGGASLIEWLLSAVDPDEVAPLTTTTDFELLADHQGYTLYAGHLLGSQTRLLPPGTETFTVIRDPVEIAISHFYHYRALRDWGKYKELGRLDNPFGNDPEPSEEWATRSQTANEVDFISSLDWDWPGLRNVLLRYYGGRLEEFNAAPTLETRIQQLQRAAETLKQISIIGDYSDFDAAILLLAARRGWPAPPSLPQIHNFGAPTEALARDSQVRDAVRRVSAFDFELYEFTRERTRQNLAEIEAICGGATREAVDTHHIERFFEQSEPIVGFDVSANRAWNGRGWSMRRNKLQTPYREFDNQRHASTLVRLNPTVGQYQVFAVMEPGSSKDAIDALLVSVGGSNLERLSIREIAGNLMASWWLPDQMVSCLQGKIELTFSVPDTLVDQPLRFIRIGCVPKLGTH